MTSGLALRIMSKACQLPHKSGISTSIVVLGEIARTWEIHLAN